MQRYLQVTNAGLAPSCTAMDDSDQDFVDLCSKPLKRVRKKPAEGRNRPKAEQKSASQASGREKRKANPREDVSSGAGGSKCARTQTDRLDLGAVRDVVCLGAGGDAAGTQRAEKVMRAKDKVLQRMQQFKRASPQKMALTGRTAAAAAVKEENDCVALPALVNQQGGTAEELAPVNCLFHTGPFILSSCFPASLSPGPQPEAQDGDEALALRLQLDLDREAAQAHIVDLEDGGLFFCHICGRDLTHMTPGGRSLHVNRCPHNVLLMCSVCLF